MSGKRGLFDSLLGKGHKPGENKASVPSMPSDLGQVRQPARPVQPRNTPGADLFQPGDLIGGRYEVHSRLGKGGFGLVYLVYDCQNQIVCALKTFRDELLADAAAQQAFKREALLWVNLERHPFILPALWVDEFSGRLFVVTFYIAPDYQGRVNLADHLIRAGGPLEMNRVLEWAIQFCHGMYHANTHGIQAHRDIKPGIIKITPEGKAMLVDFSISKVYDPSLATTVGARAVTPGYSPPEQYGKGATDIRSDYYALGATLYHSLTGHLPSDSVDILARNPNTRRGGHNGYKNSP
jgi:serine/threonine-protein kinase